MYINLEDGLKEDLDFYLTADADNNDRMRSAYIACIRLCPMWGRLYHPPQGKKRVSNDNGFLYRKNRKSKWRLVHASTFDMNGKNYFEATIKEAYEPTAHGGVE